MPPRTGGEDSHERWTAALAQRVEEREERIRRAYGAAAEAVTVPAAERRAWIASRPDCLCPEFVELMIAMAREHRGEEPRESVRFAHLAVTAAEEYVRAGGEDGDDARALAWAELGNSHRICGDLRLAGIAFHHAREKASLIADPLVRAEILSLEASFRDYNSEFEEAERLLLKAERLAHRTGTPSLRGRLLCQRAEVVRCIGRITDAIELLEDALQIINPRIDPQLALVGLHNLTYCLILGGHPKAGLRLLQRLRPAYLSFASERLIARKAWIEAEAHERLGDSDSAELLFETARDRFAELESPLDVALVGLDLARIHSLSDRWEEVERVALETLELCRSIGVRTEILAAAKLLVDVAARRQSEAEEVVSLILTLRRMLAPREAAA